MRHASSCTRRSPEGPTPTTSTSSPSATATHTTSPDPRTSTPRPPPTSSRASSPATTPPSRPPPQPETTPPPPCGSVPPPPATSTPSTSPPSTTSAPRHCRSLEAGADRIVPAIGDDPAWPTLRAHLILLAAAGTDPTTALRFAASSRELDSADDRAAVLHWRLDDHPTAGKGPLPWLPGIPQGLRDDPHWGAYLTARSELVAELATDVRHQVTSTADTPPWWPPGRSVPGPGLLGDLAVWRAANNVPDTENRPTGPTQPAKAHARWQHELDARLGGSNTATLTDWTSLIHTLVHATRRDEYTPMLAEHLAELSDAGIDAQCPAPHDHRRSATRRPRRLGPLVAHPTPPARPPRPR